MRPLDPHRDPGILNARRRKYLLPNWNLNLDGSNERKIRGEIRNRTFNALLDFPILNEIDRRDLDQILELDNVLHRPVDDLDGVEGIEKVTRVDEDTGEIKFWMKDTRGSDPLGERPYSFEKLVEIPGGDSAFRNPYLEESIIENIRFLLRLAKIENIPITSFIEDIIPEAYRRLDPENTISMDVSKESKKEVLARAREKYEQGIELTTEEKALLFNSMVEE